MVLQGLVKRHFKRYFCRLGNGTGELLVNYRLKLKGNLVYHDQSYLIAKLPKEIADKGIVVASSNNGAVKNIVNELPQRKEIYLEFKFVK